MAMTVRWGAAEDLAEWLRLRSLLWPDAPAAELAREAAAMLDGRDDTRVLVAPRQGGGLAGFIELRLRPYADGCSSSPVGYIEGWYVDAGLRRQGIGAALVAAAEAWALAQGCSEMASDAELGNRLSDTAHRRLGYAEVERVIRYRKDLL